MTESIAGFKYDSVGNLLLEMKNIIKTNATILFKGWNVLFLKFIWKQSYILTKWQIQTQIKCDISTAVCKRMLSLNASSYQKSQNNRIIQNVWIKNNSHEVHKLCEMICMCKEATLWSKVTKKCKY